MRAILVRLQNGQRWWVAELCLRTAGLWLLVLCGLAMRWCRRLTYEPPHHQATPLELAVAAIAVACLSAGLALLLEGPGLFRHVPLPPRAILP
jgi:hypothetical protein